MQRRDWKQQFDENVKKSLHLIREEARANAWRPHVSNKNQQNPHQLTWWTLGKPEDQSDLDKENRDPQVMTERRLYNKKWVGLTLSNLSPFEREAMAAFTKPLKKSEFFTFEHKFKDSDDEAGSHEESCTGHWFRDLGTHDAFVEFLNNLVARTQLFVLGEAAEQDSIKQLLAGKNYRLVSGSKATVLTVPNLGESDLVLVQMFVG